MTQKKEMSDRDLNLALAELMNYPKSRFVPNYCTDAAASLEVQTAAYSKNPIQFMRNIAEVQGWNAGARISIEEAGQLANPTLRERAEAAYITLSQVPR